MPIFLAFMLTHVALIVYGIFAHAAALRHAARRHRARHARGDRASSGLLGRDRRSSCARSRSAAARSPASRRSATAPSILREPRVETGKRTMLYMAISLVVHRRRHPALLPAERRRSTSPGKTLNASLWEHAHAAAGSVGRHRRRPGDRGVHAALRGRAAVRRRADRLHRRARARWRRWRWTSWVPKRFAHLSERLVTQNGVIAMGLAAAAGARSTRGGSVKLLVVMYSINVFLTFTLTPARHGAALVARARGRAAHWRRRLIVAARRHARDRAASWWSPSVIKFREGGWVTLVVTGAFDRLLLPGARATTGACAACCRSLDEVLTQPAAARAQDAARAGARRPDRDRAGRVLRRARHPHAALDAAHVPAPLQELRVLLGRAGGLGPVQGRRRTSQALEDKVRARPREVRDARAAHGLLRRVPLHARHRPDRGARGACAST